MMKKHWIRNCLVVCLTLLAVTGCGSSTPSSTPAEAPPAQEGSSAPPPSEPVTVRFSEVIRSIFYAPQYVAMEKGFFEEGQAPEYHHYFDTIWKELAEHVHA